MHQVLREFARNRWIELALVTIGFLMILLVPRGSIWQGIAVGLAVQVGLICFLDWFAELRAAEYLAWLQSL